MKKKLGADKKLGGFFWEKEIVCKWYISYNLIDRAYIPAIYFKYPWNGVYSNNIFYSCLQLSMKGLSCQKPDKPTC